MPFTIILSMLCLAVHFFNQYKQWHWKLKNKIWKTYQKIKCLNCRSQQNDTLTCDRRRKVYCRPLYSWDNKQPFITILIKNSIPCQVTVNKPSLEARTIYIYIYIPHAYHFWVEYMPDNLHDGDWVTKICSRVSSLVSTRFCASLAM